METIAQVLIIYIAYSKIYFLTDDIFSSPCLSMYSYASISFANFIASANSLTYCPVFPISRNPTPEFIAIIAICPPTIIKDKNKDAKSDSCYSTIKVGKPKLG